MDRFLIRTAGSFTTSRKRQNDQGDNGSETENPQDKDSVVAAMTVRELDHGVLQDNLVEESHPSNSKRKKRVFKFGENWKNGRPWLNYSNETGQMWCSYCRQFKPDSQTNKFVKGCESLRLENVRSHECSTEHKYCHTAFLNSTKKLAEQPIVKSVIKLEKAQIELMKKLFTTAFHIAKREEPFTEFAYLNELQTVNFKGYQCDKDTFVSFDKHYNNDKQARNFIRYIAAAERKKKIDLINASDFIAVATDGCTDSANVEQESFFVSYLDSNYEPHTDFVKIKGVETRATATELSQLFFEVFNELGIDVKGSCVQIGTDGPSVMKRMCTLIREEIPWVLQFHCSNHRLELAFKDAVKGILLENDAYKLLDNLHTFYDNSSLQWRTLQQSARLLGINVLVHPQAKGTRWLAHRERALNALDRNYAANLAQLEACTSDNTQLTETRAKANGLKEKLLDEDLVVFMFCFLLPLLAMFGQLSCLLQDEDISIDTLKSTVCRTQSKLENFNCEAEMKTVFSRKEY